MARMSPWTVIRIVVYTSGRIYSGFEEQIGKRMEKKRILGKSNEEAETGLLLGRNVRARFLLMRGLAYSNSCKGPMEKYLKKNTDQVTTEFVRERGHGVQAHVEKLFFNNRRATSYRRRGGMKCIQMHL